MAFIDVCKRLCVWGGEGGRGGRGRGECVESVDRQLHNRAKSTLCLPAPLPSSLPHCAQRTATSTLRSLVITEKHKDSEGRRALVFTLICPQ
jgi:hypothetical protein